MLFSQPKKLNHNAVSQLSQNLSISKTTARMLCARGMDTLERAQSFLHAGDAELSNPYGIHHMEEAVDLIHESVMEERKIVIYGDYDCDGICATSILIKTFEEIGYEAGYYIPQREGEGYGLNKKAIDKINTQGYQLLITVDCGISNHEEVQYAQSLGLDVIVTDHHSKPEIIPDCIVVNPKLGCIESQQNLCGAAVAMKLSHALTESNDCYLDLCAVATVADMVPLVEENRTLVIQGLKAINNDVNREINQLIQACFKKERHISAQDIAYFIAPTINAAGRVGDLDLCIRYISGQSSQIIQDAESLLNYNNTRKQIEQGIIDSIYKKLEFIDLTKSRSIVLYDKGWPLGVIGIAASKIKNSFFRPVVLLGESDGKIKGSCRSVEGINVFDILNRHPELFEQYGGHSMAAGLTLKEGMLEQFAAIFDEEVRAFDDKLLYPRIDIDGSIRTDDVTIQLVSELETLRPYGKDNPPPKLLAPSCKVKNLRTMGDKGQHFRADLDNSDQRLTCVAFSKKMDHSVFIDGVYCDAIVSPQINRWMGKEEIQGMLEVFQTRFTSKEAWINYIYSQEEAFHQSMAYNLYHANIDVNYYTIVDNMKVLKSRFPSAFGHLVIVPDKTAAEELYTIMGADVLNNYSVYIGTIDSHCHGENAILLAPKYDLIDCRWYDDVTWLTPVISGNAIDRIYKSLHLKRAMTIIKYYNNEYPKSSFELYYKYSMRIEELRSLYVAMKEAASNSSIQSFIASSDRYGYKGWQVDAALNVFIQASLVKRVGERYIMTDQKKVDLEVSEAYRNLLDPVNAIQRLNKLS